MSPPLSRHLSPPQVLTVDPQIWRACSGISVQVPQSNSRVYYFPEGHAEQADSSPAFSPRVFSAACVPCRVLSVEYLARRDTDEVYAKIRLRPIGRATDSEVEQIGGFEFGEVETRVKSFAKVLTPSDANNGGGFSMPKACAEVFPPLDFEADPPVQTLSMTDLHGSVWEFRHIYRGTPRRHLLTTGWSKFVNNKKLIHGDSVVFMRDTRKSTNNRYFIGVRRAMSWTARYGGGGGSSEGQGRRLLGKVPAEEVSEAAELAVNGEEFEVVYYPGAGFSNFVVNAELVERTLRTMWRPEVKVKMVLETDEPTRLMPHSGMVVSVLGSSERGMWRGGTPWRMLQIKWDDPEVMKDEDRLSPWEVECETVTAIHQQAAPLAAVQPPFKRQRLLHFEDLPPICNGVVQAEEPTLATFITSPPRLFNPSKNATYGTGIQGARLDHHHPYKALVSIPSPMFPPTPESRTVPRAADLVPSPPSSQAETAAVTAGKNGGVVQNNNDENNKDSSPDSVGIGEPNKKGSFQLFGKTISYGVKPDEEVDKVGEEV